MVAAGLAAFRRTPDHLEQLEAVMFEPDGTQGPHDHRAILSVVRDGDSVAAMNLMRRHLDHLRDSYRQMDRLRCTQKRYL